MSFLFLSWYLMNRLNHTVSEELGLLHSWGNQHLTSRMNLQEWDLRWCRQLRALRLQSWVAIPFWGPESPFSDWGHHLLPGHVKMSSACLWIAISVPPGTGQGGKLSTGLNWDNREWWCLWHAGEEVHGASVPVEATTLSWLNEQIWPGHLWLANP